MGFAHIEKATAQSVLLRQPKSRWLYLREGIWCILRYWPKLMQAGTFEYKWYLSTPGAPTALREEKPYLKEDMWFCFYLLSLRHLSEWRHFRSQTSHKMCLSVYHLTFPSRLLSQAKGVAVVLSLPSIVSLAAEGFSCFPPLQFHPSRTPCLGGS